MDATAVKSLEAKTSTGAGITNVLDHATLGDIRNLNSRMSSQDTKTGNNDMKLMEANTNGDQYSSNKDGQVTEFNYRDEEGETEKSFTDIKRDADGKVTGFKDSYGNVWEKQAPNPNSPFESERNGGGWMYENPETGESPRSPVDLGDVTIDQSGVTASGRNADYLETPER